MSAGVRLCEATLHCESRLDFPRAASFFLLSLPGQEGGWFIEIGYQQGYKGEELCPGEGQREALGQENQMTVPVLQQ